MRLTEIDKTTFNYSGDLIDLNLINHDFNNEYELFLDLRLFNVDDKVIINIGVIIDVETLNNFLIKYD